jgi:hypothetical protein
LERKTPTHLGRTTTKEPVAVTSQQVNSWPVSGLAKLSISGAPLSEADSPLESQREYAFLTLARERFRFCADSEANRRKEALEDLKFRCGNQWRPDIRAKREARGRPCHEVNRIPEFLMHVVNNMRQARPAIEIDPAGDGADQDQAENRQGLIQFIERNSQADIAYDHSFEQMCTMGLGWIRVLDDWSSWDSFDKDLYIRWVENAFQIYSDPSAALPDWSDMQFAFVVEDMLPNEFKVRYGDDYSAAQPDIFQSQGDDIAKYWFPAQKIRVAEYFYIEQEEDTLCELQMEGKSVTILLSKLPPDMYRSEGDRLLVLKSKAEEGWDEDEYEDVGRTRKCTVPTVKWAKITGLDVLERRTWKGRYIPLIPVIGNQVHLEGEKLLFGMVRFAREIQRMYNYIYSTLIEVIALAPRSQWIAAMDQIDEFRDIYERSNTDPIAVLPYKAVYGSGGQPVPPPERVGTEVAIQGLLQALTIVDNMLKSVFMIYDASLGQRGPQESGLAINARKIESETATYNWGDNFIRSLRYLGIVVNDLLEPYYNTPGRIVQILREDQQSMSPVKMNEEYTPEGQTEPVKYDLGKGKYSVAVSTGPSALTLRKEEATQIGELLKANPALFQVIGDIWIEEQDWPGAKRIAARLKKTLPPALQDQDPGSQPSPQIFQQLQQQNQQLIAALHNALDKTELQRMKEEFATLRTTLTSQAGIIEQMLKSGSEEGQFLADKAFQEAERRVALEQQLEQPGGGNSPAPGQPVQSGAPSGAPQPSLAGPQAGGG